jgi:hypothetical protein
MATEMAIKAVRIVRVASMGVDYRAIRDWGSTTQPRACDQHGRQIDDLNTTIEAMCFAPEKSMGAALLKYFFVFSTSEPWASRSNRSITDQSVYAAAKPRRLS